ncbi:hypothetical protein BBL_1202 [Burkholderia pseudomallei MSHR1328]|nr:hypothetical protein BBL_1202 [Burkholderia pseudomallei MSHR1328]
MTLIVVFLLSCLSLVIWLVLLFGRGGFWRARAARRLPPDARGAAAAAGWPPSRPSCPPATRRT